jgi:hypothetical protein
MLSAGGCAPQKQRNMGTVQGQFGADSNLGYSILGEMTREGSVTQETEPFARAIFDALTDPTQQQQSGANPPAVGVATIAGSSDLAILQAQYQKQWCDISQFTKLQPDGSRILKPVRSAAEPDGLSPTDLQTANSLKTDLWSTYNQIQSILGQSDITRELSNIGNAIMKARNASNTGPAIKPLFTMSGGQINLGKTTEVVQDAKSISAILRQSSGTRQVDASQNYPKPTVPKNPEPKAPIPAPLPTPDLPPGGPDSCRNDGLFLIPILPPFSNGGSGSDVFFYIPGQGNTPTFTEGVPEIPVTPANYPPPDNPNIAATPGPLLSLGAAAALGWSRKIRTKLKQHEARLKAAERAKSAENR